MDINAQYGLALASCQNDMGLSQKEMAQRLGLSLSTYKRIINGECKVTLDLVMQVYHVTGKMAFEMIDCDDEFLSLIVKLHDLTPRQRTFVSGMLDFETSFKDSPASEDVTVYTPTGNMSDGMIYDSCAFEKICIDHLPLYRERVDCGIKVTSNHLHPAYCKGDILLISHKPPRSGDVGIFLDKTTGCLYIRRYIQTSPCQLMPINGYGESFLVDDNNPDDMKRWFKFGTVISKVR